MLNEIISGLALLANISFTEDIRIKIAVIDSGVSEYQSKQPYMCQNGVKTYYDDNGLSRIPHGENIVSIISSKINPATHCIISYKVFDLYEKQRIKKTPPEMIDGFIGLAMRDIADRNDILYVNQSMGGGAFNDLEYQATLDFLARGGTITASAGNESKDLTEENCIYYPVCYKKDIPDARFRIVASKTPGVNGERYSNDGFVVTDYEDGRGGVPLLNGTSQASANLMAKIIERECK